MVSTIRDILIPPTYQVQTYLFSYDGGVQQNFQHWDNIDASDFISGCLWGLRSSGKCCEFESKICTFN